MAELVRAKEEEEEKRGRRGGTERGESEAAEDRAPEETGPPKISGSDCSASPWLCDSTAAPERSSSDQSQLKLSARVRTSPGFI